MTSEWIKEDYERRRREQLLAFLVKMLVNGLLLGLSLMGIYALTIMLLCG